MEGRKEGTKAVVGLFSILVLIGLSAPGVAQLPIDAGVSPNEQTKAQASCKVNSASALASGPADSNPTASASVSPVQTYQKSQDSDTLATSAASGIGLGSASASAGDASASCGYPGSVEEVVEDGATSVSQGVPGVDSVPAEMPEIGCSTEGTDETADWSTEAELVRTSDGAFALVDEDDRLLDSGSASETLVVEGSSTEGAVIHDASPTGIGASLEFVDHTCSATLTVGR